MFYRRKILLAFLGAFGSQIDKIRLQKLLFLFCQGQQEPIFHFIPYKYGCFSFQATNDLLVLKRTGVIDETETEWLLKTETVVAGELTDDDRKLLCRIESHFSGMSRRDLIRYTYLNYPFFAINSTILKQNLTDAEIVELKSISPHETGQALFTIGYEGRSLEEFINILIKNNVPLLCDVRKNAFSMKYGFSKSTLENACQNVGIRYLHTPALGIESAQRKSLENKDDYKKLFAHYRETVLVDTVEIQRKTCKQIQKAERAALMCFEADPAMCHRSYLAEAIGSVLGHKFPLRNL